MADIKDWQEVPIDDWQEVPVSSQAELPIPANKAPTGSTIGGVLNTIGETYQGTKDSLSRAYDVLSGGVKTGAMNVAGFPVDITNTLLSTVLPTSSNPVGGSSWLKQNVLPPSPQPQGFAENIVAGIGEQIPGYLFPNVNQPIASVAPLLRMMAGGGTGTGMARTVAPGNPYVEMAANMVGTMGGMVPVPRPSVTNASLGTEIAADVRQGMSKGVKPSSSKMGNIQLTDKYYANAEQAVKDIVEKKSNLQLKDAAGNLLPEGSLPKTNYEFAQAIDQSKRQVWKEIDAMKQAATGKGVEVDVTPVVRELREFASQKWIMDKYPNLANRALSRAKTLEQRGTVDINYADSTIKDANTRLDAYHKNPTPQAASSSVLENLEAMQFRKALDNAISSTEGPGFQGLKNKYGSYLEIEKDVNHRANITAGQRPYGFWGYGDVISGAEMASAMANLATGNVMGAASATGRMVGAKAITEWIKKQNAPDTSITRMFRNVDAKMSQMPYKEPFSLEGGWSPFYESPEGVPVGQPYDAFMAASRPPVPVGGQALVPTGISRSYFPMEAPITMPSNAEALLRHPMGSRSLVPTGIKKGAPSVEGAKGIPERLSIANRRIEPAQTQAPYTLLDEAVRLFRGGR